MADQASTETKAPVADAPLAAEVAPAPAAENSAPASPSLLASGDVGQRDGAPKTEVPKTETKQTEAPSTEAKAAEPAPAEVKTTETKSEPAKETAEAPKTEGKTETKPAEAEKPAEVKEGEKPKESAETAEKTAEALAAEPPAPPKYEPYKLPENFKVDQPRLDKFNQLLGETELAGKADHKAMQDLGQKLVDFHAEEMQRIANDVRQYQVDVWNRHKEDLINKFKSDPEIGGNRINTTLGNAKYAFENYLGLNGEQRKDLLVALDNAGVSDHPEFIRGLNNLYERLKPPEPVQPNLPSGQKSGRQRNWYDTQDVQSG